MALVLVVDDDRGFRELARDILTEAGYAVREAADGFEAKELLGRERFDLVLTDRQMPRLDGIGLLRAARALPAPPPVVVMTAFGSIPEAVDAVRLGAADYLTKPFPSPRALVAVVERILAAGADAEPGTPELVGEDPVFADAISVVDRVAPRDVPVLVLGESGTGKELVARRLHAKSPRGGAPFVAVNCAALPETLAESELFGADKGAFTGADRQRKGRFEEASGGTLFLDEIGELPLALQAKLLRVLEEKSVRRLGGTREIPVDVRLVAATNRELEAEVRAGRFRDDLRFRLAVVTIVLPPLRERPGDVPLLARHLLADLARRHRLPLPAVEPATLDRLRAHDWPGNVRELRNVLERALVVRGGESIRPDDLGLTGPPTMPPSPARTDPAVPLERDAWERESLREALRKSDGNREKAAELLGISIRTLYYRLRKLGGD